MWIRLLLVGMLMSALPAHALVIYACVNNSSGTIKIVAQGDVCPINSIKTSLSTTAPQPPPPRTSMLRAGARSFPLPPCLRVRFSRNSICHQANT